MNEELERIKLYSCNVEMLQKAAFNIVVNKALNLSLAEKSILICLTDYIRDSSWSFNLSIDRLSLQVSATQKTISKAIKSLEKKGFITQRKADYCINHDFILIFPSVHR